MYIWIELLGLVMQNKKIRVALLLDKAGEYDRGLIRGIVKYSHHTAPFEFFLISPNFISKEGTGLILNKLKSWQPDCIVMWDAFLLVEFKALGIPILVTPSKKLVSGVINIVADDYKIGELGARYFIDKGFKNFAFYGTDQIFWSKKRKEAFKKSVSSLNFNFYEFEALINTDWQNNPERLIDWMKSLPVPIAIMACNDDFGIHLIEASNMSGKKVPEDIAILGVDNDKFICELYNPPMSSIDQEPELVGLEVAKYIRALLQEGKPPGDVIVGNNYTIVTRRSTDIFAVEDEQIKKALHFIEVNALQKNITVSDVVSSTSLSRRILEIRFRKLLNRSILQEIRHIRIEIICEKLIKTNIPINEIAYSMEFNSVTTFSSYFKAEKKITPMEFRKQFRSK